VLSNTSPDGPDGIPDIRTDGGADDHADCIADRRVLCIWLF